MFFTIFQNEKMPFKAIKRRSSKSVKIEVLPRGLTYGFVQNWLYSIFLFLCNIGQENLFYDILERRNAFLGYKNKNFEKSKNRNFPRTVNPWFWSKNAHFSIIFLCDIQAWIFQNEKKPFQAIKTKTSKSPKIEFFPKGLTHGFGPNMVIFQCFFLGIIGQENLFYFILDNKMPFQAIKRRTSKSPKIQTFPKGLTYGFAPKLAQFHFSFFMQYRPGKFVLRYSRTKKCLSRL